MVEAIVVVVLGIIGFGTLYAISAAIYFYIKYTRQSKISVSESSNAETVEEAEDSSTAAEELPQYRYTYHGFDSLNNVVVVYPSTIPNSENDLPPAYDDLIYQPQQPPPYKQL